MAEQVSRAEARLAEWFGNGRRWRLCTEWTGTREYAPGQQVTYRNGAFKIEPPGKFRSPFGSPGRAGVVLAELAADGGDTGPYVAFGMTVVKRAAERYGKILGLDELASL